MEKRLGKSICIFSGKGGVGKTITTLNLAGIYEIMEKKVLIIDMDLFSGGISLALNKAYKKTIANFVQDTINHKYQNFQDYITKYDDYIDILASPKDPRQATKINPKYIDLIVSLAKTYYDVVLIDTTHILNEINLILLDKVDSILFVLNNDPLDLKNIKSILTIFRNLEKTNYKILLNNSRDPFKNYFTLYDIKNIIKNEVDYDLSCEFYLKNMDQYIMNGKIVTLQPKAPSVFSRDFKVLTLMATNLLEMGENK